MAAVVFDLGNVLIEWSPRRVLHDAFIDETDFFTWNAELDRGVPFDDVVARAAAQFPQFADQFALFSERWTDLLGDVLDDVVAIADALRAAGTPVYVLTNSSAETLPRSTVVQSLLARFDGTLISGAVGLIKPDAAIFEHAVALWALEPSTTWFIDDNEPNVIGARAVGWNAILFRDAASLQSQLVDAGLL